MKRFIAKNGQLSTGTQKRNSRTLARLMPSLASAVLLFLAIGIPSVPALAQGCAMCYATAKATPKEGQLAINRGILIMLFPPIGAMTLGIGAAFRYGKKRDREADTRN